MKLGLGLSLTGMQRRRDTLAFTPDALFANGEQGVWLDPSDLTTLYQDSAGTTPVTADGDPVGRIEDKSGNGNHATQNTAAARPLYRTDGTLHWLEFDGVDDEMSTASFITVGAGFYAAHGFNVLQEGGNASSGNTFGSIGSTDRSSIGWRSSGTYAYGTEVRVGSGAIYREDFGVPGGTGSFGTNFVGEGWHDQVNLSVRLSNGRSGSREAITSDTSGLRDLTLANDSNYRFYGGVYVDGIPPSGSVRDQVQEYFAGKSGVTL